MGTSGNPATKAKQKAEADAKAEDPTRSMQRPATLDHLRSKKKPVEDVEIRTDPELAAEYDRVENRIQMLQILASQTGATASAAEELLHLRTRVDDLREAIEPTVVVMRLQSLGRKAFDELQTAHPPTEEQVEEHKQETIGQVIRAGKAVDEAEAERKFWTPPDFNHETFPPALIAACCIVPEGLTEEDVKSFESDWNESEYTNLFAAAVRVHSVSRVGHWGKASG